MVEAGLVELADELLAAGKVAAREQVIEGLVHIDAARPLLAAADDGPAHDLPVDLAMLHHAAARGLDDHRLERMLHDGADHAVFGGEEVGAAEETIEGREGDDLVLETGGVIAPHIDDAAVELRSHDRGIGREVAALGMPTDAQGAHGLGRDPPQIAQRVLLRGDDAIADFAVLDPADDRVVGAAEAHIGRPIGKEDRDGRELLMGVLVEDALVIADPGVAVALAGGGQVVEQVVGALGDQRAVVGELDAGRGDCLADAHELRLALLSVGGCVEAMGCQEAGLGLIGRHHVVGADCPVELHIAELGKNEVVHLVEGDGLEIEVAVPVQIVEEVCHAMLQSDAPGQGHGPMP